MVNLLVPTKSAMKNYYYYLHKVGAQKLSRGMDDQRALLKRILLEFFKFKLSCDFVP